jgi:hypothetical protein
MFTDKQIDAATAAYVASRWKDAATWRANFPLQWAEIRERMKLALEATRAVAG